MTTSLVDGTNQYNIAIVNGGMGDGSQLLQVGPPAGVVSPLLQGSNQTGVIYNNLGLFTYWYTCMLGIVINCNTLALFY